MQTFAPRGKIHGPILPQFVLETSLSFGAKIMYALLCNYASDSDRCWPSQATLAARLSCSVSSVKKYLAELAAMQLICVRREHYRSSVYYMLEPAALKSASKETKAVCCPSNSACPQPKAGYINTLNKQREIQNPPLPPVRPVLPEVVDSPLPSVLGGGGPTRRARSVPVSESSSVTGIESNDVSLPDFDQAWELYPKKEAKGLARAAWLNLKHQGQLPPLSKIESSIRHFMATDSWQREQGRFVPQMSNWLKGQRWLDDSVTAAVKEEVAAQRAVTALKAMQQKEEALKAAQAVAREALRPRFDVFAEKFQLDTTPWLRPMAFGLWMHLHTTHRAPAPEDVPEDTILNIIEFLKAFKRRCEEAAWRMSSAQERAALPASGAFCIPHISAPLPCGDRRLHHPVPSRQPALLAFAKAI